VRASTDSRGPLDCLKKQEKVKRFWGAHCTVPKIGERGFLHIQWGGNGGRNNGDELATQRKMGKTIFGTWQVGGEGKGCREVNGRTVAEISPTVG